MRRLIDVDWLSGTALWPVLAASILRDFGFAGFGTLLVRQMERRSTQPWRLCDSSQQALFIVPL
jgi:hypothetical protein